MDIIGDIGRPDAQRKESKKQSSKFQNSSCQVPFADIAEKEANGQEYVHLCAQVLTKFMLTPAK
jgi:hypothetical protein